MRRWRLITALALISVADAPLASAQPSEASSTGIDLQVHAFVSQGFLVSTDNNYLARSERGSFEFTEVGINFTSALTENLRIGLQLFAHDIGPVGNYDARVDWFYLDYRFTDWFGLRAGRVKLPVGLYNEFNDIDAGRTSVLLPQSVYPIQNRDFLLAQTGVELYGRLGLASAGSLEYRVYGGTVFFELEPAADSSLNDIAIPYLAGARLLWETPLPGLRVGASLQTLRLEGQLQFDGAAREALRMMYNLGPMFDGAIGVKLPASLWVGSAEYAWDDLLLAAEYARWYTDLQTDIALPGFKAKTVSERAYVLASYRVNSWLQPGIYYSMLFPDVDMREGRAWQQHDVAATLRFDLNAYWLCKLEAHYMNGTAALNPNLNGGRSDEVAEVVRSRLERSWGLFLLRTTAYF